MEEKYLYFRTAADDAGVFPLSSLMYVDQNTADKIKFVFDLQGGSPTAGTTDYKVITCSVTANKEKEAIADFFDKVDKSPSRLFNVADDVAGNYSGYITAVDGAINVDISADSVILALTADQSLTSADSGKTIIINGNGVDVTLPTAAAGDTFTFIAGQDIATTNSTIVQAAASEDFFGVVVTGATAVVDTPATGDTKINFVAGAAKKGDRIECVSDGTNWFIKGFCLAAGGITFA